MDSPLELKFTKLILLILFELAEDRKEVDAQHRMNYRLFLIIQTKFNFT